MGVNEGSGVSREGQESVGVTGQRGINKVGQRSLSKDVSSMVIKTRYQGIVRSPRAEIGVSLLGQRSMRYLGNSMKSRTTEVSS